MTCECRTICPECDGRTYFYDQPDEWTGCIHCDGFGNVRCSNRPAGFRPGGTVACEAHLLWTLPPAPLVQR